MFSIKKGFPLLWGGFLSCFVALMLISRAYEKEPMFLVVPCVMAIIGFYYMKVSIWDLVDEVYDCNDFLLVRNRGEEDKVLLSNIINVNFSMNVKPAHITLSLARPRKFGAEISFAPPSQFYLSPLPKNEIAEDLIVRADKARSKRAV